MKNVKLDIIGQFMKINKKWKHLFVQMNFSFGYCTVFLYIGFKIKIIFQGCCNRFPFRYHRRRRIIWPWFRSLYSLNVGLRFWCCFENLHNTILASMAKTVEYCFSQLPISLVDPNVVSVYSLDLALPPNQKPCSHDFLQHRSLCCQMSHLILIVLQLLKTDSWPRR